MQGRSSLQTLFERVYSAPVLTPQPMLEAGLTNVGDTRRLERAMHKLIHGTVTSYQTAVATLTRHCMISSPGAKLGCRTYLTVAMLLGTGAAMGLSPGILATCHAFGHNV